MTNQNNITENAFTFIKYRCGVCGKIMRTNRNFCSLDCRALYFKKMIENRNGITINKKRQRKIHIYNLSELLNEENLKAMVEESEKNIDIIIRKSRR